MTNRTPVVNLHKKYLTVEVLDILKTAGDSGMSYEDIHIKIVRKRSGVTDKKLFGTLKRLEDQKLIVRKKRSIYRENNVWTVVRNLEE